MNTLISPYPKSLPKKEGYVSPPILGAEQIIVDKKEIRYLNQPQNLTVSVRPVGV